jgi:hypothetical protein
MQNDRMSRRRVLWLPKPPSLQNLCVTRLQEMTWNGQVVLPFPRRISDQQGAPRIQRDSNTGQKTNRKLIECVGKLKTTGPNRRNTRTDPKTGQPINLKTGQTTNRKPVESKPLRKRPSTISRKVYRTGAVIPAGSFPGQRSSKALDPFRAPLRATNEEGETAMP